MDPRTVGLGAVWAFRELPITMLVCSPAGVVLDATEGALRESGLDRADVVGGGLAAVVAGCLTSPPAGLSESLGLGLGVVVAAGRSHSFDAGGGRAVALRPLSAGGDLGPLILVAIEGLPDARLAADRPATAAGGAAQDRGGRVVEELGRLLGAPSGIDAGPGRVVGTESQAESGDRRRGMILATVGHELRNPLAAIRMAVEVLELSAGGEGPAPPIAIIKRQVAALMGMLDDILDLSRIARGTISVESREVGLADVLAQSVESVQALIDGKGHRLDVRLGRDLPTIQGDPLRLQRVFMNVLSNAARYTPDGGHIELTAGRAGDAVEVSVRDDGIGIPAENLATIFDADARPEVGRERHPGGLGIGLTIARELVQRHGGSIRARSDGPGLGSEFIIHLPCRGAR